MIVLLIFINVNLRRGTPRLYYTLSPINYPLLNRNVGLDVRVRIVPFEGEILVLEIKQRFHLGVQLHCG